MSKYNELFVKAQHLIKKLQNDITTGKRTICENYGDKEVNRFVDNKLNDSGLSYNEICNIKAELWKVYDIC